MWEQRFRGKVNRYVDEKVENWLQSKSFESEQFYERLGVKTFKNYRNRADIVLGKLLKLKPVEEYRLQGSDVTALRRMEALTRRNEIFHLRWFFLGNTLAVLPLLDGNYVAAAFIAGINMLSDAYPIMMQRYNRIRLQRVISKKEQREQRRTAEVQDNLVAKEVLQERPEES